MSDERLSDWGEFRIINELILPIFSDSLLDSPLGDDCAYVNLTGDPNHLLVITTDATPKPLAWELGHHSFEMWGWYSVLINVSDLAAAGASPLAFTTSVEAPPDTYLQDFRDFFSGVRSACKEMGIASAGGNIRAAPRFESHGTAIGLVNKIQKIDRSGCRPGDKVFIIGQSGRFITAYLNARRRGLEKLSVDERKSLIRPMPQLSAMNILREAGVVHAASDNSDGVLGAIWNVAERSACGVEIFLDEKLIPNYVAEVATIENLNPWNLMFFWGDWQVIVAVSPDSLDLFDRLVARHKIESLLIGQAIPTPPGLYSYSNGNRHAINLLRQENFKATSYNTNVDEQLRFMLQSDLFSLGRS